MNASVSVIEIEVMCQEAWVLHPPKNGGKPILGTYCQVCSLDRRALGKKTLYFPPEYGEENEWRCPCGGKLEHPRLMAGF